MLVSQENLCLVADTHKDSDKVQAIKDFVHSVMEKLDGWRDEHKEEVEFLPLTLGMTNQLFAIKTTQEDCTHKSVVVRIYGEGTGDLIDRDNELWVQTEIGNLGLSAKVLARFQNGLILQHLPGCSLDPFVVRDPETSKGIARALAKLHRNLEAKEDEEQARRSQFWDTVDRWIAKIEKTNPNMVHEITVQHGDDEDSQESVVVTAEALRSYAEEIQRFVESQDLPVVFCHNDLNSENIIRHEDTIYVIDFEYAGFNYRAFDLGNHFCEWAGVATKSDFAKYYPKEDEQLRFLQSYLLESQDEKFTQEDLGKLLRESQIGTLLSHFMWAIWGFTQDSISTLSYDYVEYATIRMQNFVKLWPSFVSSSP